MDRRATTALAWAGGLLLTASHLGAWAGPRDGFVLGWLPDELAFRLVWMAAAVIYLVWFCRAVWRDEPTAEDGEGPTA
jgi:hypothetical protein